MGAGQLMVPPRAAGVPGEPEQPTDRPIEREVETVPLETDDDGEEVIRQQNVGRDAEGSGEWPSPDSPPRGPSPG